MCDDEKAKILERISKARTVTVFYTLLDKKKKNTEIQISKNFYFEEEKKAVSSIIDALELIGCNVYIDSHEFGNSNHLLDIYLSKRKRLSVWINMV